MSRDFYLDKNKFDYYLTALGKEYKKLSKNPVQIVLVGGGAIFIRYSFRIMSLDLDGLLFPYKSDALKHAIHIVSDKYNIPVGWLNDDFIKTTFEIWTMLMANPLVYDLIDMDSRMRDNRKTDYEIVI